MFPMFGESRVGALWAYSGCVLTVARGGRIPRRAAGCRSPEVRGGSSQDGFKPVPWSAERRLLGEDYGARHQVLVIGTGPLIENKRAEIRA